MASTQVAPINTLGQMKRVHFQPDGLGGTPAEEVLPHFVSPKKIVKSLNYRKRATSFSENKYGHHFKRRRKEEFVRPTKFLLGGNSRDPLNLGSLADEKINKALNEHTPESSPLPTPKHRKEEIEVLIPPNICDPLNLSVTDDDLAERALISPNAVIKRKRKNRKRRRTNSASEVLDAGKKSSELDHRMFLDSIRAIDTDKPEENIQASVRLDVISDSVVVCSSSSSSTITEPKQGDITVTTSCQKEVQKDFKLKLEPVRGHGGHGLHSRRPEDKIVSPVVPQPGTGVRKRGSGFFTRSVSKDVSASSTSSCHRPFMRNVSTKECSGTGRGSNMGGGCLNLFKAQHPQQAPITGQMKRFQYGNYDRYYGYRNPNCEDLRLSCFRREWFDNHQVLDIGCNAGHVTLCIARDFNPSQIVGIDIDAKLIALARKNVKTFVNTHPDEQKFPISMPLMYGSIPGPNSSNGRRSSAFPGNVSFVHGNYVPDSDELTQMVNPEYDTILCLSVTKWIHLNWGDAGLKRLFHRIFAHLKPGGKLILEAQGWASYNKRKKLTVSSDNDLLFHWLLFTDCTLLFLAGGDSQKLCRHSAVSGTIQRLLAFTSRIFNL